MALVAGLTPRFTIEPVLSGPELGAGPAADRTLIGERQRQRVSELLAGARPDAPLDSEIACEVTRRLDDPRFDLDLRLGTIERA